MIVWRDSFNIGVDSIDTQHQELVVRLNDFMDACTQQKAKEKIEETLEFLKAYTVEHFHDEEQLMKDAGYPGYELHKKEHVDFVQTIDHLLGQVQNQGTSILTTLKLNRMLVDWLLNHIQRNDVKVGDFIKRQSASA